MPRNVSNGRVKSSVGQRTVKPNGGPLTRRVTKPGVREPSSTLVECVINKRISVRRGEPNDRAYSAWMMVVSCQSSIELRADFTDPFTESRESKIKI